MFGQPADYLKDNLPTVQTWRQNLPLLHFIIKYQHNHKLNACITNSTDNLNVKAYQVIINR